MIVVSDASQLRRLCCSPSAETSATALLAVDFGSSAELPTVPAVSVELLQERELHFIALIRPTDTAVTSVSTPLQSNSGTQHACHFTGFNTGRRTTHIVSLTSLLMGTPGVADVWCIRQAVHCRLASLANCLAHTADNA